MVAPALHGPMKWGGETERSIHIQAPLGGGGKKWSTHTQVPYGRGEEMERSTPAQAPFSGPGEKVEWSTHTQDGWEDMEWPTCVMERME